MNIADISIECNGVMNQSIELFDMSISEFKRKVKKGKIVTSLGFEKGKRLSNDVFDISDNGFKEIGRVIYQASSDEMEIDGMVFEEET